MAAINLYRCPSSVSLARPQCARCSPPMRQICQKRRHSVEHEATNQKTHKRECFDNFKQNALSKEFNPSEDMQLSTIPVEKYVRVLMSPIKVSRSEIWWTCLFGEVLYWNHQRKNAGWLTRKGSVPTPVAKPSCLEIWQLVEEAEYQISESSDHSD